MGAFTGLGARLASELLQGATTLRRCDDGAAAVRTADGSRLDLEPVDCPVGAADGRDFFSGVASAGQLIDAWQAARAEGTFEEDEPALAGQVHGHAAEHLHALLDEALDSLSPEQAQAIGEFAAGLDVYAAVRAVECLLNSPADRALLELAPANGWRVHFDHLAIRCGCEDRADAARVARLLADRHGYRAPQLPRQREYRFDDGWNAQPVYKMLDNGTLVRLFVDESALGHPQHVITHWNHVYGFTAHHLALRATRTGPDGEPQAVALADLVAALADRGVVTLQPTGASTGGLLEQVFTQPRITPRLPEAIEIQLAQTDPGLPATLRHGKLTELVSRREMPPALAREYFSLYGLRPGGRDGLTSAPAYAYFLPAQAAHVIATSTGTPA